MNKFSRTCLVFGVAFAILTSCQSGRGFSVSADVADTLQMKYAGLLTMVSHTGYMEVCIANPWKEGQALHRYFLVPKGKEGDELVSELKDICDGNGNGNGGSNTSEERQVVRTPLDNSVVFTSPHCQLFYELRQEKAIGGVCDLAYINIPNIKRRAALGKGKRTLSWIAAPVCNLPWNKSST